MKCSEDLIKLYFDKVCLIKVYYLIDISLMPFCYENILSSVNAADRGP